MEGKLFNQAFKAIESSVGGYVDSHPACADQKVLERLAEPECCVAFPVLWLDDDGEVQINKGYYVQMNGALGHFAISLRFHPSVDMDAIAFLALEKTFSEALEALPYGGAAAGSDFCPRGKSEPEVMAFCKSFMTELQKYLTPGCQFPTAELGVGRRELDFMAGQYRRMNCEWCEVSCPEPSLPEVELSGKTVAISGSGKTAQKVASDVLAAGARIVTMSDSDGFIYDRAGIDADKLAYICELKNEFSGRLKAYVSKYPQAEYFAGERPWSVKCDVAIPCACENEIDGTAAKALLKNGCSCVVEMALMPSTEDAVAAFEKAGISYFPGFVQGEDAVEAFGRLSAAIIAQGL